MKTASMNSKQRRLLRDWRIWLILSIAGLLIYFAFGITISIHAQFYCLGCDQRRFEVTFLGNTYSSMRDTEYSRWVRKLTPEHKHNWIFRGRIGTNFLGLLTFCAAGEISLPHIVCVLKAAHQAGTLSTAEVTLRLKRLENANNKLDKEIEDLTEDLPQRESYRYHGQHNIVPRE